MPKNFTIPRLTTDRGTFRIAGSWCGARSAPVEVQVDSIEIMGTDGWVELDLKNENVIALIRELAPSVQDHLPTKKVHT